MATSAFVPGAGGDSGADPERAADALAQARHEATTLRGVLEAIQDALVAATTRLEALEAQMGFDGAEDGAPHGAGGAEGASNAAGTGSPLAGFGTLPSLPPLAPGHGFTRHPGWKLPGWTPPAGGDEAVTGEALRLRREALGISQAAVAHAAHCSRGLVAEVERGKRRSAQTLAHLAKVLDRLEQQARRN